MPLMKFVWLFVVLDLVVGQTDQRSSEIEDDGKTTLGGVFFDDEPILESVFRFAVEEFGGFKAITKQLQRGHVMDAQTKMCELFEEGIYGIVDGTSGPMTSHIQALCDSMDIPHVIVNINDEQTGNWSVVNLHPSPEAYNRILKDLIRKKSWSDFTILYVKGHSLTRVSDLLKLNGQFHPYTVSAWELSGSNYRPVLNQVKNSGSTNFVVDSPFEYLFQILTQAQQIGLMADEHSYVFVSPNLHTLDLNPYKHGGANITGLRVIDPSESHYQSFYEKFKNFSQSDSFDLKLENLTTTLLLTYDAVSVYSTTLQNLRAIPERLSCQKGKSWNLGTSVTNLMKTSTVEGLTRQIVFDSSGDRSDILFDVFELTPVTLQVVAKANRTGFIDVRPFSLSPQASDERTMKNKTFIVLLSKTEPFAFIKQTVLKLEGNDRYEGFAVDIIDEISKILGFNYIFELEDENGSLLPDGVTWTGMMRKIKNDLADFAISDLTITTDRLKAVDFSDPFMNLGISILYRKPSKQPPEMFSFMQAFSKQVWISMFFSIIGLGFVMIFIGRLSHKEWHNPYPCVPQPEKLVNQFSLANAIWLIIGSVMQQGSEIAPIAVAPRMLTSVWWFFTMVMISSYTGLLVAFFTIENNVPTFKSAEDLAYQHKITYGAVKGGSTLGFFKNSKNKHYRHMYEQMVKHDSWLPKKNAQGRYKVQTENYAFFMESTSIEYQTERYCDLMQIGGLLDAKSYGIAMKKNSPYRADITNAILQLKEKGTLAKLKDKWWTEQRGGGACKNADQGGDNEQLEMKNLIGVFVVLGFGCIGGILIAIMDMFWGVFKRSIKYQSSFKDELIEELKFAIKFSGDTKPVPRRDSLEDDLSSNQSIETHKTGRSTRTIASSRRSQSVALARRRRYS